MDIEKSEFEDDDTNCYQISDEGEEDYEKNEESNNNSDAASQFSRGPYERAWTTEATRALIHIRGPMEEEFSEGRAKRTLLWIQVTKQLHKMGFRYSAAKVQKKWHNILITYNKNIAKKEETGTVAWEFFEDMYLYLKGKKAKTFEYFPEKPIKQKVQQQSNLDHQTELQQQMQQQHQIIQRQRSQARQRLEQSKHPQYREKTDSIRSATPRTSQYYNDSSNTNEEVQMMDEEDSSTKRPNEDDNYEQPKPKQQKKINSFADYFYEQPLDRLPLEISHVEGATEEPKFENLDEDPFSDTDWWRDYFNKKLDTEKEKISLQKQMHRDVMNYNKMCLMQQEKIERIKIEAINNLTATLQKLVEVKTHKKI
ncbi:uncharacterized protein LOC129614648 [Condylostylus longicornis]|uniref:uncharacterized protein LOC129614648 n=1 Tax=Condylostylus longicornis TaxID=2530218 RepID=UPI00244E35FA|nr:uncharacterized protein LOC129614648 [Condylostylus longicornis]